MCIISAEEEATVREYWLKVSRTNIFARHTRPGVQAIVYKLSIASSSQAAMILPIPIVPGSGEDALRFIDLSGYETFFDDLALACKTEFVSMTEDFETLGLGDDTALIL